MGCAASDAHHDAAGRVEDAEQPYQPYLTELVLKDWVLDLPKDIKTPTAGEDEGIRRWIDSVFEELSQCNDDSSTIPGTILEASKTSSPGDVQSVDSSLEGYRCQVSRDL